MAFSLRNLRQRTLGLEEQNIDTNRIHTCARYRSCGELAVLIAGLAEIVKLWKSN